MQYRYLGRSALKVSPLCLGAMLFGEATDEATSQRIVGLARDAGVNFVDTADVYAAGKSEEVLGRSIARDRDSWVVATKFTNPMGPGPNQSGYSRKWVTTAVDASLKRLGTDYIDILYIHRIVYGQPLDEPIRVLGDLIRAGKVRYFAVSNYHGWRIAEVCRIADSFGIDRPVAIEPLYNIVNRQAEVEQIPAAAHYGVGVVSYSPLARGVLTGQYTPGAPPPAGTRAARNDRRIQQTEWRPESIEIAQKIKVYAETRGMSASQFAAAWAMNNRLVASIIGGPRTVEQWDGYLKAVEVKLTAEDETFVNALVAPGHSSTLYFTDPANPVEGRVPFSAPPTSR